MSAGIGYSARHLGYSPGPMADADSRAGARYGTPAVLELVEALHVPHDPALERAFTAPAREGIPAIQVGRSEGRLLTLVLRMIGAKKVVEVGTLAAYSTIHLARGIAPGGHVFTIESEPRHAAIARDNLAAAGLADRVTVLVGAARDVLPTLDDRAPFDAVFIDADKGNYDHYGRWAAKALRPGGLLLGDNAYYFGKLDDRDDPAAQAMRRFHEEACLAFDTVCAPTPDGLLVGVRR